MSLSNVCWKFECWMYKVVKKKEATAKGYIQTYSIKLKIKYELVYI